MLLGRSRCCNLLSVKIQASTKIGTRITRPAISGLLYGRHAASISSTEELRNHLKETVRKDPAIFGLTSLSSFTDNSSSEILDLNSFQKMINMVIPDMGDQETKALFMSMDTSNDNAIQAAEIFADQTMRILMNRMKMSVTHPLEGSYHCLPSPPFHPDPKQLEVIRKLKSVYAEVVAENSKPLPPIQVPPSQKKPLETAGLFGGLFGGIKKAKPSKPGDKPKKAAGPKPVEFVPQPMAPKGAYLYGGCGCGKTVILDLFFRSLPEGCTARRLHWHEFIRDVFRFMHTISAEDNVFAAMANSLAQEFRILLLDELLITHISEAILVKNLFRHMWARGMTIITTSNYLPEHLYAKGFNRETFVDFIPELAAQCPVIDMTTDKDYRQEDISSSGDGFFVSPINAHSSSIMDKNFDELVGENRETDTKLEIPHESRAITVPRSGVDDRGADVARFTFNDLCVANKGRADYSVLAEMYHTIFIDKVPKFQADLGTEFRRFVSLTDILYGKKVAVYLQSEVPIEELFAAASMDPELDLDEVWAFRRCSSMLCEMQSPKYHHIVWLMRNHMLQEAALKLRR